MGCVGEGGRGGGKEFLIIFVWGRAGFHFESSQDKVEDLVFQAITSGV